MSARVCVGLRYMLVYKYVRRGTCKVLVFSTLLSPCLHPPLCPHRCQVPKVIAAVESHRARALIAAAVAEYVR